jgi:small subunit ribosomal protein S20
MPFGYAAGGCIVAESAKKRMRQNEKRRMHNKHIKSGCKTQVKKVLAAIEASDHEKAEKELAIATKNFYKAANLNIYHPNAAARKVSRLARKVGALARPSVAEQEIVESRVVDKNL